MNQDKINRKKEFVFLLVLGLLILPILVFLSTRRNYTGNAFGQQFIDAAESTMGGLIQNNWFLYVFIAFILIIIAAGISYILHEEKRIKKIFKREREEKTDALVEDENEENQIDPALDSFIKESIKNGYSKEDIINSLVNAGWDQTSIDDAMNKIG
jgi:uncharacterized membrane protein YcjF (UPF0283 family)